MIRGESRSRKGDALYWIHGDHLGSTAITTGDLGVKESELRYYPYGSGRYIWGTTPTAYKFTGQMLDESTGLYFYNARYYDPSLGRFIHADTVVPDPMDPQQLNRYSYVLNNPLRYTDPSGHWLESLLDFAFIGYDIHQIATEGWTTENTLALVADLACLILPGPTGGGSGMRLALAGGGQVATRAAVRVPVGARAAQVGLKVVQFAQGSPSGEGPSSGADEEGVGKLDDYAWRFRRAVGRDPLPGHHSHHGLPQEFTKWFAKQGIDIHAPENLFELPNELHTRVQKGVHTTGPTGKTWNRHWEEFMWRNPNATPEEIYAFLDELARMFDIAGYRVTVP